MFNIPSRSGQPIDAIYAGGGWRLLAVRDSSIKGRRLFAPFAAANPIIPRTQWHAVSRPRGNVPILDQGQEGSCVGHGSTSALMLARDIAGCGFQLLSPCFVYSLIDGGADNGADPADAATTLLSKGACLMSEFPEGNYLESRIPASAYVTALRFKALDVYCCANFDEAVSAFLLGFSVFDTIQCGASFNNLNADGIPPVAWGPGNHCVSFGDSLKQISNGSWVIEHRNSWGTSWGLTGRYFQSEAHCTAQGNAYEAYAIRSVQDDPSDPLSLPS